MHTAAKKWDEENEWEKHKAFFSVQKVKALPLNRPCDWCGKPVKRGYIHIGPPENCWKKEAEFWLDILY